MKIVKYTFAALALIFGYSCAHDADHDHDHEHTEAHDDHDHDHEGHDHDAEDHDEHDHDHDHEGHEHNDDEIRLSAERAAKLGVKVDTVRLANINEVVKVTGEVVSDPANRSVVTAPVSGRLTFTSTVREGTSVNKGQTLAKISGADYVGGDADRQARLDCDAAKRELDRIKGLLDEGLATRGEYNEAERAFQAAKNAIGRHGGNAIAPMAGVITTVDVANGQYVDAGATIAEISGNGPLTVRADVPKRYSKAAKTARTATIRLPYSDTTIDATLASKQTDAAATTAYLPVYFNIPRNTDLSPGSFVEVYLNVGAGKPGIKVPLSAVTERLGQKFVYVKVDADCYERRPVTVGVTDGAYIEITSGLASGDAVVTEGATFVRLAETSNVAPPGHTHNH